MLAVPLAKLAVGVKTAVRVRPVPLMAPKEPPVTTRSPELPAQAKMFIYIGGHDYSGSSENVKVMLAVCPALSAAKLLAMLTVGAKVSIEITGVTPALPELPALSV